MTLPPGDVIEGEFCQLLGKVTPDGAMLDATRVQNAGNNFDMKNYNDFLNLADSKFKELFQE